MTSQQRTIVVCGATGQQGGAVVNSLLRSGHWNVVALSRQPDGKAARGLRQRGVELRQADLLDRTALTRAFAGAYGVYGVTTPMTSRGKLDIERERQQGFNIADACRDNEVQHLVLSTVLYIDEAQKAVPYVRSKQDIEAYVAAAAIPYTFLRPASFMDEIGGEFLPVRNGVVTGQADDDARVPYIACQDIGEFARLAFCDPGTFAGRKLNLIGDFISGTELADVLSRASNGKPFKHKAPPMWLMWLFARQWITLRKQFESWGRPPHPDALLDALEESRRLLPSILSFEEYLQATGFGRAPQAAAP